MTTIQDNSVITMSLKVAEEIYNQLSNKQIPKLDIPDRSIRNVKLTSEGLTIGDRKFIRSAGKLSTAKTFAQLSWLIWFINKELLSTGRTTTLRDVYYTSMSYEDIAYKEEYESNQIIQDLEALTGQTREQFNIYPKERAVIFGDAKFKYVHARPWIPHVDKIYSLNEHPDGLPIGPELTANSEFIEVNADKIIVAEKQAVFRRFVEEQVDKKYNALLVFTEGQPPRNCRLLIRRLSEQFNLPVYCLADGDPYGLSIFLTIKYNSITLAHVKGLNIPQAKWVGITAEDIINYKLPVDPKKGKFTDKDTKKLYDLMKDPRCKNDEYIMSQLRLWEKLKKKVELEAFSKYGLSFIVDKYLKDKLEMNMKR